MRYDMGKVVIERPRSNSSARSAKARWYGKVTEDEEGLDYDGPTRLPATSKQEGLFPKIGEKDQTDVLGPIEGFLRSNCGRPWDKVYSELANGLGRSTWGVRHILHAHVNVAAHTYCGSDGQIWEMGDRGPEVVGKPCRSSEFYVDPKTGILKESKHQSRKERRKDPTELDLWRVDAGDGKWYVNIGGVWFLGEYSAAVSPVDPTFIPRYRWQNPRYISPIFPDYRVGYGGDMMVFRKLKSCNKKEIKRLLAARDEYFKKHFPWYGHPATVR